MLRHLSQIDILRALPPEEIQALVPYVKQVIYHTGTCLMREGEKGDALYLIEHGNARVTKASTGETWQVTSGSAVGEGALLTGDVRSATVTAETELTTWRVSREAFQQAVTSSPSLKQALEDLMEARRIGIHKPLPSSRAWIGTALRAAMESHGPAWASLVAQDLDPDEVLVRHRDDGSESRAPRGIRIAQVIHHGTDHRSQVCTILTTLGIEPPLIDVWDFADQDGRLVDTAPSA